MTEQSDAGEGLGVGEELARARAALGLSLGDVARQLKFATRQIEALEQGRYEELPTGTFARGMVRAYARLLKLDAEPMVERIAARVAVPDNATAVASARRPIPITDSSRRGNLIYAALSLVILAVIAGVVFEWQRERMGAARLSFAAPAQAPSAEPQRTAVASTVAPPKLAAMTQAAPAPPAAARPATPATPAPLEPGTHRIAMKFERSSWVEIRGHDGKTLFSKLNAAGAEETVAGRAPFSLIIGNAQYVRLSYDDRPIDLTPHVKVEVARFKLE